MQRHCVASTIASCSISICCNLSILQRKLHRNLLFYFSQWAVNLQLVSWFLSFLCQPAVFLNILICFIGECHLKFLAGRKTNCVRLTLHCSLQYFYHNAVPLQVARLGFNKQPGISRPFPFPPRPAPLLLYSV